MTCPGHDSAAHVHRGDDRHEHDEFVEQEHRQVHEAHCDPGEGHVVLGEKVRSQDREPERAYGVIIPTRDWGAEHAKSEHTPEAMAELDRIETERARLEVQAKLDADEYPELPPGEVGHQIARDFGIILPGDPMSDPPHRAWADPRTLDRAHP